MFTKFASLEDVEILDLKGSSSQVKTASLDKIADFNDFRTDDGYLYARIRAISSRVNKNHDGWPSIELAGGQDIFDKHASQSKTAAFTAAVEDGANYGYSTFLGKPIFIDHNNSDPSRARGVIVDAKLHVEDQKTAALDPYYASEDVNPLHVPPTWVELLLEVDAKSFPKFAQAILDGSTDSTQGIDGFSMGANVERTECNICKNSATTPEEFCDHIKNKGALYDYIDPVSGQKTAKRSYEDCFPPDTSIALGDGSSKAISEINVGDEVLDHIGIARKVTKIYKREERDSLYEIHRVGQGFDRPTTVTENHPILAIRNDGRSRKQLESALEFGNIEPEFIEAKDLQEGDWLAEVNPEHRPSLKTVLTPRITKYLRKDIPKEIALDSEFGRWCGWYLAEGSVKYCRLSNGEKSENSLIFGLHIDETEYQQEILDIGKRLFGIEGKVVKRPEINSATVEFHNRPLSLFMSQLGVSSKTKALPSEWLSGPIEFIEGVVTAHCDGDGFQDTRGHRPNELIHITSSENLADQIYQMNIWLGHTPSRRLDKPTISNKRTVAATHIAVPEIRQRKARGRVAYGPWTLAKVTRIEQVDYEGPVYNLHVDGTHTYVANGHAVHNCFGVQFFEISGVFDPADETALIREVVSKTNPFEEPSEYNLPPEGDDDRNRKVCAVCEGEGGKCSRCDGAGYLYDPSHTKTEQTVRDIASLPETDHPLGPQTGSHHARQIVEGSGSSDLSSSFLFDSPEQSNESAKVAADHFDEWKFEEQFDGDNDPDADGDVVVYGNDGYPIDTDYWSWTTEFDDIEEFAASRGMTLEEALEEGVFEYDGGPGTDMEGDPVPSAPHAMGRIYYPSDWDPKRGPGGPGNNSAPRIEGNVKTAANPLPQSELTHVPDEVDTLRKERVCEVCGSTMDSEQCDVCGYIEPPEGFDNPDLTKATPENANENIQLEPNGLASNTPTTAHVNSDMSWNISMPSRIAETVVTPNKGPASDEPEEEVIEDPSKPITSSVRTAADFLAAAGANPRRTNMKREADAATGAPEVATPDTNVDADGVGGVLDATNESASEADTQIPVEGIGGTDPNVDAEDTIAVDQGDEKSKNIEAIPTKTFGQGNSAVERQADPVSSKPFPSKDSAVEGWRIEALDAGAFPRTEDSPAGDSASSGASPADPVGNAKERVDLTQPATSPSNNSGPTKTWSGTDGSGVTRQQEPTTNQSLEGADGVKSSARLMTAFKLADLEIELGLLEKQGKYARVEELQGQSDDSVASALAYAEKVKTAGLSKGSPKTASRFPSLARSASVESSKSGKTVTPDEALFS